MALERIGAGATLLATRVQDAQGRTAYLSTNLPYADTRQLADNQNLAAGATTTPVEGLTRGEYTLTVLPANTAIHLEALGPDKTTWLDVGAISGREIVRVGEGASLRLKNTGGSAINGVSASLT